MNTGYSANTEWGTSGSYTTTVKDIISNNGVSLTGATFESPTVSVSGDLVEADSKKWVNASLAFSVAIKVSASYLTGSCKVKYAWSDSTTVADWNSQAEATFNDGAFYASYTSTNKNAYFVYALFDSSDNKIYENSYSLSEIYFDLTAPVISSVAFQDVSGVDPQTVDNLENWQTGTIQVTIQAADGEATGNETASGLKTITVTDNGQEVNLTNETDGKYTFTLTTDGTHKLVITAFDKAGNQSASVEKTVKIDQSGVTSNQVTCNGSTEISAFSGNFTVEAEAESVSGIARVEFVFSDTISNTSKTILVTNITVDDNGTTNHAVCQFPTDAFPEGFAGTVKATFYDNTGVAVTPHIAVSAEKSLSYNKNGASITLHASNQWTNTSVPVTVVITDKATEFKKIEFLVNGTVVKTVTSFDNLHEYTGGIQVSDTSPSVEGTKVTVNVTSTAGVVSTDYIYVYVDKQTPEIALSGITENSIYNTNRTLTITTTENIWQRMQAVTVTATKTIDGVTTNLDLGSYTVDGAVQAVGKSFTEDGIYTVTVTAVDAAGNRNSKSTTFTIDKTAPVLSISGVSDGAYSSSPVTLSFQAIESFYDTDNVTITVEREMEGTVYGSTVNFVSTGKTSSVSNTFSVDGNYTVTMTAVDAAGNVATVQTLSFTIDVTAPVVSISGTEDYFITSQGVTVSFSVTESYYETNQVQIVGSRKTADGRVIALSIADWTNTGKTSSLTQEFTEDGYYTLTLTSTDKAGNTKQQVIHFTIDTEEPVIADLSRYNGKYFTSFKLEEDFESLITELTAPTVKMTLNGKAYDGSEITEDGKYTLLIEVTDEVFLTASQTIEFVVDNTAPKIIFAGAENGKTYTEAVKLNMSLENENDTIVRILINGEEYELTDGKTAYDLEFNTYGEYTVTVETIDEAGNENSQTVVFTYAEHKNTSYLWIFVSAIVILIGLIAVAAVYFKKKRNA